MKHHWSCQSSVKNFLGTQRSAEDLNFILYVEQMLKEQKCFFLFRPCLEQDKQGKSLSLLTLLGISHSLTQEFRGDYKLNRKNIESQGFL